ncbi:hypothetical protein B0H11DRAFT_1934547 [Mycena galericulata]|nr:hypothetical protein B0H11DRAFT_1934547 [Mycena galericulata]
MKRYFDGGQSDDVGGTGCKRCEQLNSGVIGPGADSRPSRRIVRETKMEEEMEMRRDENARSDNCPYKCESNFAWRMEVEDSRGVTTARGKEIRRGQQHRRRFNFRTESSPISIKRKESKCGDEREDGARKLEGIEVSKIRASSSARGKIRVDETETHSNEDEGGDEDEDDLEARGRKESRDATHRACCPLVDERAEVVDARSDLADLLRALLDEGLLDIKRSEQLNWVRFRKFDSIEDSMTEQIDVLRRRCTIAACSRRCTGRGRDTGGDWMKARHGVSQCVMEDNKGGLEERKRTESTVLFASQHCRRAT